ncbi:alkaline phosphatase [Candidatus Riflebacteria bacterium]
MDNSKVNIFTRVIFFLFIVLVLPTGAVNARDKKPKNIILMIGDGFGPQAMGAYTMYTHTIQHRPSSFEKVMNQGTLGVCDTHPYFNIVSDSSAGGTALATGFKTRNEMVGMGPHGEDLETVLEYAQKIGKATGLVTNTTITHATPASFYAAWAKRNDETIIADQLFKNGAIDVLFGGGLTQFIPQGKKASDYAKIHPLQEGRSYRKDNMNLLESAKSKGYTTVFNANELKEAPLRGKILGLFGGTHLPYAVDRMNIPGMNVPSLLEMTEAAIQRLERNRKGFFLMVESGKMDHVLHANDGGALFREMEETDKVFEFLFAYAKKRGDTLLVLTADHETGGFGFSYQKRRGGKLKLTLKSGAEYVTKYNYADLKLFQMLMSQTRSFKLLINEAAKDPKKLVELIKLHTPFRINEKLAQIVLTKGPRDYAAFYTGYASRPISVLSSILSGQTSIVWSSGTHTHTPVFCISYGPYSSRLKGYFQNIKVGQVIFQALGKKEMYFPKGL